MESAARFRIIASGAFSSCWPAFRLPRTPQRLRTVAAGNARPPCAERAQRRNHCGRRHSRRPHDCLGHRAGLLHRGFVCLHAKERKMLEGLGRFLESEGLNPKLILNRHDGVYRLHVSGAEQSARVIKNIEPLMRTVRKKEEIVNFKESIATPRKKLRPEIRIAREILGLTEN